MREAALNCDRKWGELEVLHGGNAANICLCSILFGDGGKKCYCGFGDSKKREMNVQARTKASRPAEEATRNTKTKARFGRRVPKGQMNISLIVGCVRADIDPSVFYFRLSYFTDDKAAMGMIAMERGDSQLQLHIKGVLSIKSSGTKSLKADISTAVGWKENGPPGDSICLKTLMEKRLHTLLEMMGYCLKDENDIDLVFFGTSPNDKFWSFMHPSDIMIHDTSVRNSDKKLAEMKSKLAEISPSQEDA
ncbi:hypothetical protein R1sor_000350 [Riccia sorocarpa]|uniref:Uncharacterized protein n=1 Tax=Riccia sorocarpa TaxID=122646 RepID=A0ABD3GTN7_9MARC